MTLAMLGSPAWIALDPCAKVKSTQNGNISASLAQLRHRGWKSPATLSKSLKQLLVLGFLIKTRSTIGVEKAPKFAIYIDSLIWNRINGKSWIFQHPERLTNGRNFKI